MTIVVPQVVCVVVGVCSLAHAARIARRIVIGAAPPGSAPAVVVFLTIAACSLGYAAWQMIWPHAPYRYQLAAGLGCGALPFAAAAAYQVSTRRRQRREQLEKQGSHPYGCCSGGRSEQHNRTAPGEQEKTS